MQCVHLNNLCCAISSAISCGGFNPSYAGSCNSLLNFRDWNTPIPPVVPTVGTIASPLISCTFACVEACVTSDGGASLTENGIVLGTSVNPTIANCCMPIALQSVGTTYGCCATGLVAGTCYYYRGYACNCVGIAYDTVTQQGFTTCSASGMHNIYAVQESDNISSTCECGCYCFASNPAMSAGNCYNITFSWELYKVNTPFAPTNQFMCILCNGTIKATCSISSKPAFTCTGTLSSFTVIPGDLLEAVVKAQVNCTAEIAWACVYKTCRKTNSSL